MVHFFRFWYYVPKKSGNPGLDVKKASAARFLADPKHFLPQQK
jgi:hypothetical protein